MTTSVADVPAVSPERSSPSPRLAEMGGADALSERLAQEMIQRWRDQERPLAEEFLNRHPELWQQPEAAIGLIYEEICLRRDLGADASLGDLLRRFPQWQPQLEVLFGCDEVLAAGEAPARFPVVGEALGDFTLLAELGHGAQGCVFLATQRSLADRPLVLKLTPCDGREHLLLARLQHTHIVPLYWAEDDDARNLRVLCMPYFGGVTLDRLLAGLPSLPLDQCTGRHLLDALDGAVRAAPVSLPARGPARQFLAEVSFTQAMCWVAASLAEALQYAHERGLVHLDVKPSNVLVATDGQPMLLDFHLAQAPLVPQQPAPPWLGGTPAFMAPEHEAALVAGQKRRPIAQAVDGRADIFSLGAMLYGALGGQLPVRPGESPSLRKVNPCVPRGLADIIDKCLASAADDRYPAAAFLAADLQRHLTDLPLEGVPNRSLPERWRKWRRRRPMALALLVMLLAVAGAAVAVGISTASHFHEQRDEARTALADGQERLHNHQPAQAVRVLQRGLALAEGLPFTGALRQELTDHLGAARQAQATAERAQAARQLHLVANQMRFLYGADALPAGDLGQLAAHCRTLWEKRAVILERLGPEPAADVKADLLDLVILWTDWRVRLAAADQAGDARREAMQVLAQAEELFGPSPVLALEYQAHAAALGLTFAPSQGNLSTRRRLPTAWEHYALARFLLRWQAPPSLPSAWGGFLLSGPTNLGSLQLALAAGELERALALDPGGIWPNFYAGVCAYRLGRYEDAVSAFSFCAGSAPETAGFFYNRALALAALGHADRAVRDFDQAVRLDPGLARNRAALHYNLAVAQLTRGDRDAAQHSLRQALEGNPRHREARQLFDRFPGKTRQGGPLLESH